MFVIPYVMRVGIASLYTVHLVKRVGRGKNVLGVLESPGILLCILRRCCQRRLEVLARTCFYVCFLCFWCTYCVLVSLFLVVSTSAIDCLERHISEMTCCVLSGTLNPTHTTQLQ